MNCRFCQKELKDEFIDLVNSPPSNSFLTQDQLNDAELYHPLKVYICNSCFLVQIDEFKKSSAIFNAEYVYFSSYSKSWLEHSKKYTDYMVDRFGFNSSHTVVEIASNDGYLLQYFKEKNIPVLGIEPTKNTAQVALDKGIPTLIEFFGKELALELVEKNIKADLIIGNNVLAHVPDIVDFVKGLQVILKLDGVVTMEFPHIVNLIDFTQFDTIYHEHYSYLSLYTVNKIFDTFDLQLFDVEEISTHGGSLRIFAKHKSNTSISINPNVNFLLEKEILKGINTISYYDNFKYKVLKIKLNFLKFLISQKELGKKIIGYGAAAKGNTLLNYCGIKQDFIEFVVDLNPSKKSKYLPGSHIEVRDFASIASYQPDFVIILPWNLKEEILESLDFIRSWGGQFVIAIPELEIL